MCYASAVMLRGRCSCASSFLLIPSSNPQLPLSPFRPPLAHSLACTSPNPFPFNLIRYPEGEGVGSIMLTSPPLPQRRVSYFCQPLQHGLDAGVDGEVRDAGAADDVGLALDVGEMQEAAEVVIFVEDVEERLDFRGAELKVGESNGLAETAYNGQIAVHNFAKAQHGRTASGIVNRQSIAPQCSASGEPREARVWHAARDSVRCWAAIPTTERNTL